MRPQQPPAAPPYPPTQYAGQGAFGGPTRQAVFPNHPGSQADPGGHPAPPPADTPSAAAVFVPLLVGAAVSTGLGVFAKVHDPQFFSVNVAGFSSPVSVKAWIATLAAALALTQLLSAAAMYGKLGAPKPALGIVHVWTGRLAVLVSVPVAVHCLYALGYADHETRVMVHSILGCFLYGVFVAKMLLLTRKSTPSWAVPLFGGVLLAAFVGIWSTSSLWFFQNAGFVL